MHKKINHTLNKGGGMKSSQKAKILEYMKTHDHITPIDALNKFGCFRLGARIYDLKKDGYKIENIGNNKYAIYRLLSETHISDLSELKVADTKDMPKYDMVIHISNVNASEYKPKYVIGDMADVQKECGK